MPIPVKNKHTKAHAKPTAKQVQDVKDRLILQHELLLGLAAAENKGLHGKLVVKDEFEVLQDITCQALKELWRRS